MGKKNKKSVGQKIDRAIEVGQTAYEVGRAIEGKIDGLGNNGNLAHNPSQVGAATGKKLVGVKYDANWQGYVNDDEMWHLLLDDRVKERKLLRSFQLAPVGIFSPCCIIFSLCGWYQKCSKKGLFQCRNRTSLCYKIDQPRCCCAHIVEPPVLSIYTDQIEKVEQHCQCVFPFIFCCKKIDTDVENIWEPGVLTHAQIMTLHEGGDTCCAKGYSHFEIVPSEASGGEPLAFHIGGPIQDRRRLYVEFEKVMLQLRTCLENKTPAWRAQQGIGGLDKVKGKGKDFTGTQKMEEDGTKGANNIGRDAAGLAFKVAGQGLQMAVGMT